MRVSKEGKVLVTQLGRYGAIIKPRQSRVLDTKSGDPMKVGEERELCVGKTTLFASSILQCIVQMKRSSPLR